MGVCQKETTFEGRRGNCSYARVEPAAASVRVRWGCLPPLLGRYGPHEGVRSCSPTNVKRKGRLESGRESGGADWRAQRPDRG